MKNRGCEYREFYEGENWGGGGGVEKLGDSIIILLKILYIKFINLIGFELIKKFLFNLVYLVLEGFI